MPAPLPLRAGRSLALIGIALVALNLRTAVSAISPIAREVAVDIPLGDASLGLIGMVPPAAFALSGIFGAALARHLGLERFLVAAILAMVLGHLVRASAASFAALLIGTVVVMLGMGIGNVLLPPLVKRYFPDRVGVVTSLYATVLAIGTAVPAIVAAPVADSIGWRVSVGMWSIVALLSLLPWLAVLMQHRAPIPTAAQLPALAKNPVGKLGLIRHSRTAWTLGVIFAVSSFNAYAVYAWLPEILIDTTSQSAVTAGALLGLYAAVGLPLALVVPMLATRMKNVGWLVQAGVLSFVLGYIGLIMVPDTAVWLWVALVRTGSLMFPACLVLIGLRCRTALGAVSLSGFVQGLGYTLGALGPLLVGVLHEIFGGWLGAELLLLSSALVAAVGGLVLGKSGFVEDEIELHRMRLGTTRR